MKRLISVLICALLIMCLSGCGGNTKILTMEGATWGLATVESNRNGEVVAYDPKADPDFSGDYPDAVMMSMSVTADNNSLMLTDLTSGVIYSGTYEEISASEESAEYKITLEGADGEAVVTASEYNPSTDLLTLVITAGDYDLTFRSFFDE